MKESVIKMWKSFSIGKEEREPVASFFCDNQSDADYCADLVSKGIKRATASLLQSYQEEGFPLPKVGDCFVVTNWDGEAVCIVQISKVSIHRFSEITPAQAFREGEGDRSLDHWRKVHREFFERELTAKGVSFDESVLVVFEEFDRVYP